MFYLEAQTKVVTSPLKDEIQQGDVVLPTAETGATPKTNGTQRGNGRRKKR